MEHIGIDVHKNESRICILTEAGKVIEQRIRTERGRFAAVLGARPKAHILIEASTESEWVARCPEALGYQVVAADPNYAPIYDNPSQKSELKERKGSPAFSSTGSSSAPYPRLAGERRSSGPSRKA